MSLNKINSTKRHTVKNKKRFLLVEHFSESECFERVNLDSIKINQKK